jgi:hypothetical protein
MKKQTRIGLMVLVTLMLTLALTIPGLAEKPTAPEDCMLAFPITNKANNILTTESIPGVHAIVDWVEGTLINTCSGDGIPFGEIVEGETGVFTWLSYADLADLDGWDWTSTSATLTADSADIAHDWRWVWDTDDNAYKSTYWELTIYSDGNFVLTKEYTP